MQRAVGTYQAEVLRDRMFKIMSMYLIKVIAASQVQRNVKAFTQPRPRIYINVQYILSKLLNIVDMFTLPAPYQTLDFRVARPPQEKHIGHSSVKDPAGSRSSWYLVHHTCNLSQQAFAPKSVEKFLESTTNQQTNKPWNAPVTACEEGMILQEVDLRR